MDLMEKSRELLEAEESFVSVRICSGEFLGTALLVTANEIFGKLEDKNFQQELEVLAKEILEEKQKSQMLQCGDREIFFEYCVPADTMLIVGAGHIGIKLCQLAKITGFRVIVVDDRKDFANSENLPEADKIIVSSFEETLQKMSMGKHYYVVLVTRGHVHDVECMRILLKKKTAYTGTLGSYRRLQGVFQLLQKEGYKEKDLHKIHKPIGLPIGAQSPEEIAISILAEAISVKYQGSDWTLSLKENFRKKSRGA